MWTKDVIPALAKRYFVIAPDLRGSGNSGKPSEGYDKRTLASDVYEVVKGLGIAKILLVGTTSAQPSPTPTRRSTGRRSPGSSSTRC